jgi:Predicted xylanase/chitin deacetylase
MQRRFVIGLFCFAALLGCCFIEQKVYQITAKEAIADNNVVEKKVAYLTFDDGPSDVTEKVLDILEQNHIKATFFLVGSEISDDKKDILIKMVKEGHAIGIHTYSHKKNEIYGSADAYVKDLEKTYDKIYEITGVKPSIYRFPWGSNNCYLNGIGDTIIEQMKAKGFTYYDWNVSGEDSVGNPSALRIIRNIKRSLKYNEPVILLHDSKINENTAKALPEIIQIIKDDGYEFDTVNHRTRPYQYKRK